MLDKASLTLERLARSFEEQERLEDVDAILEDLVLDRYTREGGLVREEGDFVAKYLGVARLDEEWWQTGKVAKERRDVRMCEVLVDPVLTEKALDRVERVVRLGRGKVVEWLQRNSSKLSWNAIERETTINAPCWWSNSRTTSSSRPKGS